MRALSYQKFGEPAEVLSVADVATPEPGVGEVRIAMRLSPIHNHDLLTVSGRYGYKPELPALAGSEGMGVVEKLGRDVTGLAVGQRVAASGLKGAWAEFAVARAASVVPLPDSISDETAAQLIAMPLSALKLIEYSGIGKDEWLIQNAANGAVAKVLSQLAKMRGINVINLVRRPEAADELEGLGIGNVVVTEGDDWKDKVAALTGGKPIIIGVDGVGGKASGDMMSLLGEGAQLICFGLMSGKPMEIPSGDVIFKQATVKGFWLAKLMAEMGPDEVRRLVGELVTRAASGEMILQTAGIYDLSDAAAAMTASATSGRQGKILIRS